jgi:hypothetical protein
MFFEWNGNIRISGIGHINIIKGYAISAASQTLPLSSTPQFKSFPCVRSSYFSLPSS